MACRGADVPGLNKPLKEHDLEESRNIYNGLPDDSQQPEILDLHIRDLATLFVRNHAHKIFGVHLIHGHFALPQNTALLGTNSDTPCGRWARATEIRAIDLSNVHGHVFVLTDQTFHPYEYQAGPPPDLSRVGDTFFQELADYLRANNLSSLIGLQVIDHNSAAMLELVLPRGTVMWEVSNLIGCVPTRQTGWKFEVENCQPRVCKSNETHGTHENGHKIYNEGAPCPNLVTLQDVKNALARAGIFRAVSTIQY
ncbi:hypothetical protein F5Y16DRAFT_406210 [Xylariaceae sp. FL0255]|nr:hypothetical protein F5Y16DRAFT_406210 [Xylariaceae sp. FL0255]